MGGTIRRRCDRNRFANGTILNIYIMKNAFTLKEIADWLNLNSEIQLPALQRAHVQPGMALKEAQNEAPAHMA